MNSQLLNLISTRVSGVQNCSPYVADKIFNEFKESKTKGVKNENFKIAHEICSFRKKQDN